MNFHDPYFFAGMILTLLIAYGTLIALIVFCRREFAKPRQIELRVFDGFICPLAISIFDEPTAEELSELIEKIEAVANSQPPLWKESNGQ